MIKRHWMYECYISIEVIEVDELDSVRFCFNFFTGTHFGKLSFLHLQIPKKSFIFNPS